MYRVILALATGALVIAAGAFQQQKSEQARAMIAVLEDVKSTQGPGPFLLSPVLPGPERVRHDSALLSEISSVALRVTAPNPPHVLDTFVLSIEVPRKVADGLYNVRAGGYLAQMVSGGCRIGGPSNTYEIRCTGEQCAAKVLTRSTGSGRCSG